MVWTLVQVSLRDGDLVAQGVFTTSRSAHQAEKKSVHWRGNESEKKFEISLTAIVLSPMAPL